MAKSFIIALILISCFSVLPHESAQAITGPINQTLYNSISYPGNFSYVQEDQNGTQNVIYYNVSDVGFIKNAKVTYVLVESNDTYSPYLPDKINYHGYLFVSKVKFVTYYLEQNSGFILALFEHRVFTLFNASNMEKLTNASALLVQITPEESFQSKIGILTGQTFEENMKVFADTKYLAPELAPPIDVNYTLQFLYTFVNSYYSTMDLSNNMTVIKQVMHCGTGELCKNKDVTYNYKINASEGLLPKDIDIKSASLNYKYHYTLQHISWANVQYQDPTAFAKHFISAASGFEYYLVLALLPLIILVIKRRKNNA